MKSALTSRPSRFMGVFTLSMINVSAILTLSSVPSMSLMGVVFISYLLLATLFFFLPTALVSAELVTAWPLPGGLYDWVKLAFGPQIGFLAVWLQWLANIIWYPTIFISAIASFTDFFFPSLANNHLVLFLAMVGIFWLITGINLRGMRNSSSISKLGVLLGVILPSVIIVSFAIIWIINKQPVGTIFAWHELIPHFDKLENLSLLLGLIVTLVGMEMSAVHSDRVDKPRTTYARAALLSAGIIISVFIIASLSLTVIIPAKHLDIILGVIQVIEKFCNTFHMHWLSDVLNVLIFFGILAMASTWIAGPSKGFRMACLNSEKLAFLDKQNKFDMPNRIMILQAIIFTALSSLMLFIPTINNAYWILIALTGQLYMLMYFIMFITGIRLRYKYPEVIREFSIPGKHNLGMLITAFFGITGTIFCFTLTYFQPSNMSEISNKFFISMLVIAFLLAAGLPVVLMYLYKYFRLREDIPSPAMHELELPEKIIKQNRVNKFYQQIFNKKPNS